LPDLNNLAVPAQQVQSALHAIAHAFAFDQLLLRSRQKFPLSLISPD